MKKKFLAMASCLMAFMFTAFGCGGPGPSVNPGDSDGPGEMVRPEGDRIVIYAGGSSEFSWVAGSEEEQVIDYIENAYWEDTGNSLNFEIAYLGEDMQAKLQSELAANNQVDIAISHTRGGVGVDDKLKGKGAHYDLTDPLYDYAPNLLEAIKGAPLYSLTTSNNDIVGIPSVISPYKFGILVRKDFMEQAGYTDDPAQVAEGKILVDNLDDFGDMCREINKITGSTYAVTGAAWDLEKVLTLGAYGDAGYFSKALVTQKDSSGTLKERIMDGGTTEAYKNVLKLEYDWVQSGVISKDSNSITLETGESHFIAGKTGVFVLDPTIQHLIKVARMTQNANPDAKFTVLPPLKAHRGDPADAKRGFMRNPQATFAAVITGVSQKVTEIMKFLNWVYQDADHYNLCRYGVEGTHWINNGDGTYSFPEGKESYATMPPYSGILTLVENQNMSNLRYDGYSEDEIRWIDEIAGNPDNYIKNDVMDYLFTSTDQFNTLLGSKTDLIYTMAVEAWTGKGDPTRDNGKGVQVFDAVMKEYNDALGGLQDHYTAQYKTMKASREAE